MMKKSPIGILDLGINSISLLNTLAVQFPYEDFIYVNDFEQVEYEGLEFGVIENRIKNNVDFLLQYGVKLIVVVSNTIIEYYESHFEEIPVPVVNVVDSIINFVNDNYEHKNMVFLARDNIMKANMYQKNFRYNHLYSIASDNLLSIVKTNKTKTNESFMATKEALKVLFKKDVDIIIPSNVNLMLLRTEMNEYVKETEILNVSTLLVEKIKAALLAIENFYNKRKGKILILVKSNTSLPPIHHLLTVRHKIIKFKQMKE